VDLVAEALNDRGKALKGAKVGVVGVAFKPDVQDARNSPAGAILPLVIERGAELRYHDPLIPTFRDDAGTVHEGVGLESLLAWADVLVIVTPHRVIGWAELFASSDLVVDTVNASRGRPVGDRQVLRLGAGWSRADAPG
jgi:UDP-N-acetyl-D-mannosaminuronate dehydrogenase